MKRKYKWLFDKTAETKVTVSVRRQKRCRNMLMEENNSNILSRISTNTCLKGHFMYLKIENHWAYSPLLFLSQPPETVSQTAMVIGSESFCTSTFKLILTLWGKHLWHSPRKVILCVGALLSQPQALLALAASSCLTVIKGEERINETFSPQCSQPNRRQK